MDIIKWYKLKLLQAKWQEANVEKKNQPEHSRGMLKCEPIHDKQEVYDSVNIYIYQYIF